MPTYLYGLLLTQHADSVPRDVRGIGDSVVGVLRCGGLAALVSTIERLPERATLDDVRIHDAVLQSAVGAGVTVVAARFRQALATDGDVCTHVRDRRARIARILEEFDGCAEMRLLLRDADGLRESDPPTSAARSSTTPGRAYLEELRARRTTDLSLAGALGPVVRAERVSTLPYDAGAVFAHLVELDRVNEYRQLVQSFAALHDARVVGPLALYSFSEPEP